MFKIVNSISQEKTKQLEKEYFMFTFFKAPVACSFKQVHVNIRILEEINLVWIILYGSMKGCLCVCPQ